MTNSQESPPRGIERPRRAARADAFVALGANLGDRLAQLREAIRRLAPQVELVACSRVFETAPIGPPGQGPYLNAVLWLRTEREARELLGRLLAVEAAVGRVREREARWGPRVLDLDLLLHGDHRIRERGLELPHPRLHERAFVLEPLCDLVPDRRHPRSGRTFRELAALVRDPAAVRVFAPPLGLAGRGPMKEAKDGDRSRQHLARR